MKFLTLVVCLAIFIAGMWFGFHSKQCDDAGWTVGVGDHAGEWLDYYALDANLPGANAQFSATNAQIFQPSQVGLVTSTSPIYCGSFNIDASVKASSLEGKLQWAVAAQSVGHFRDLSGEFAGNG